MIAAAVGLLIATIAQRPAAALDHVKLSYVLSSVEYADDFLAIDKGYFSDAGIDIALQQARRGVAVASAELRAANWSPSR